MSDKIDILEKRVEELEKFKEESITMFLRVQKGLGVYVTNDKGEFQIRVAIPKKGGFMGVVAGLLTKVNKLGNQVERIATERKIIIPK